MTAKVIGLSRDFQHDAYQVTVGSLDLRANVMIKQIVEVVTDYEKYNRLCDHLRNYNDGSRVLIFVETKKGCDQLTRSLQVLHSLLFNLLLLLQFILFLIFYYLLFFFSSYRQCVMWETLKLLFPFSLIEYVLLFFCSRARDILPAVSMGTRLSKRSDRQTDRQSTINTLDHHFPYS